jgi:hypothetical protein
LVHDTKTGKNVPNEHKMYQMNTKFTKWTQNAPNEHKIFQMVIKYPKNIPNKVGISFSNLRPWKISQIWYFWFENKPSGNPAVEWAIWS